MSKKLTRKVLRNLVKQVIQEQKKSLYVEIEDPDGTRRVVDLYKETQEERTYKAKEEFSRWWRRLDSQTRYEIEVWLSKHIRTPEIDKQTLLDEIAKIVSATKGQTEPKEPNSKPD